VSHEARLRELDITLPPPGKPGGLYTPCVQTGTLLFVSGQVPVVDGQLTVRGKLGAGVSLEMGQDLARRCALNALGHVRAQLGTLDRVVRAVKVNGYVASATGFTQQPQVINGASQLLLDVFGEAGGHARAAVGVAELPGGAPVEVEFIFEVSDAVPESAKKGKAAEKKDEGKKAKKK
jgi:enamine deaminase RidA (YjgF/YER057c/UK114 family)